MQIQSISSIKNAPKSKVQQNFKGMHLINSTPRSTQAMLDLHHVFARNASEAHLSFDEAGKGIFGFTFPKGYESIEHSFLTMIDQLKGFYGDANIDHLMINEPKRSLAEEISRRTVVRKTIAGFKNLQDKEAITLERPTSTPSKVAAQGERHPIGFHQSSSEKV